MKSRKSPNAQWRAYQRAQYDEIIRDYEAEKRHRQEAIDRLLTPEQAKEIVANGGNPLEAA